MILGQIEKKRPRVWSDNNINKLKKSKEREREQDVCKESFWLKWQTKQNKLNKSKQTNKGKQTKQINKSKQK